MLKKKNFTTESHSIIQLDTIMKQLKETFLNEKSAFIFNLILTDAISMHQIDKQQIRQNP